MQNSPVPGEQPAAPPGEPEDQARATRVATIALIASLMIVVVLTGVLATVAVLMTRNPDAPLLSTVAVRRLQTPMHFAPVTAVQQAPCPGADAVLDDAGATCYQVAPGVTVTTVQKIEAVKDTNGTYEVRVVLAPDSRSKIADLTRDTVKQQLAIVVGDRVVTAPRVAQAITEDSLSIAGFTKDAANLLVRRLVGPDASSGPTGAPSTPPAGSPSVPPATSPATGTSGAVSPAATGSPAGVRTSPATGATSSPVTAATDGANNPHAAGARTGRPTPGGTRGLDPQFATCKEAHANGYGPYTKGRHKEYEWYAAEDKDHDGVACDPQDLAA